MKNEKLTKEGALLLGEVAPPIVRAELVDDFRHSKQIRPIDFDGTKRNQALNLQSAGRLQAVLLPQLQAVIGEPIVPLYNNIVAYERLSSLPQHVDHRSDFNVSIALAAEGALAQSWPLYVKGTETITKLNLREGEGALYLGKVTPHWRPTMPYTMTELIVLLLHYGPAPTQPTHSG